MFAFEVIDRDFIVFDSAVQCKYDLETVEDVISMTAFLVLILIQNDKLNFRNGRQITMAFEYV